MHELISVYRYIKNSELLHSVYEWTLFKMVKEDLLDMQSLGNSSISELYLFLSECIFDENDQLVSMQVSLFFSYILTFAYFTFYL